MISVITGVSVSGVTLGVAALIVVLSVMNGFYDFVREMLVSIDPHIRIESVESTGIQNVEEITSAAITLKEVIGVTPVVEGKAMLIGEGQQINKVVVVRGVDMSTVRQVSTVLDHVDFGSFDVARSDGLPGVVIGSSLGRRFGLFPASSGGGASRISLVSAQGLERSLTKIIGAPPFRGFEVRGLFELQSIYDESHVFVDIEEAQRLFSSGSAITAVEVKLSRIGQAETVKAELQEILPSGKYRVKTWYDLQKSLYDVMKLEKWGASIILVLIVLVAAFNIVGSLTMVVIEKRADIGILRSMGFRKSDIRGVFLLEGLFIGILGVLSGVAVGLGLALAQKYFKLVPLAEQESFLIDAYPIAIQPMDIILVVIVAIGLCMVAAIYPAHRAAQLEPADAVRSMG
ncbi:MAG: FtsX-like permease family protein [Rhodothermales bacterium]|nr:FtsX-like permease family protein [Rhodothermales bacterium]